MAPPPLVNSCPRPAALRGRGRQSLLPGGRVRRQLQSRLPCGSSRRRAQGPGRGAALGARHPHLSGPRGAPAARPRPPLIGSPRRRPLAGAGRGAAGAAACEQSVISACSARRPFPQFPARPPPPSARQEGASGAAPAPPGGGSPAGAAASPRGGLGSVPPHPPRGKGSDAAFPRETGPRHRRGCGDCGWIFPAPPARLPPPTRRAGRAREHGLHVAGPAVPTGSQQLPPCRGFARPHPAQGLPSAQELPCFFSSPRSPGPPAAAHRVQPPPQSGLPPVPLPVVSPPARTARCPRPSLRRPPAAPPPGTPSPLRDTRFSPHSPGDVPAGPAVPPGGAATHRWREPRLTGARAAAALHPLLYFPLFVRRSPFRWRLPRPRAGGGGAWLPAAPANRRQRCVRRRPMGAQPLRVIGGCPAAWPECQRGVRAVSPRHRLSQCSLLPSPPRPGGSGGGGRRCLALPRA